MEASFLGDLRKLAIDRASRVPVPRTSEDSARWTWSAENPTANHLSDLPVERLIDGVAVLVFLYFHVLVARVILEVVGSAKIAVEDTLPALELGEGRYYVTAVTYQGQTRHGRKRSIDGALTGRDPALLPGCSE
jgi:hypothetical protein